MIEIRHLGLEDKRLGKFLKIADLPLLTGGAEIARGEVNYV